MCYEGMLDPDAKAVRRRDYMRSWRESNRLRVKAVQGAWNRANVERRRAALKAWKLANPEAVKRHTATASANPKHTRRAFDRWLGKKYGLSRAEYDEMVVGCYGKCEVCGEPDNGQPGLCVDHDHVTGRVRGMLCNRCNTTLGFSGESVDRLMYLAEYLNCRKEK